MADNLTGEQIQYIMDTLLYRAIRPIILHSDWFDAQVEYLLHMSSTNRKRKISTLDIAVRPLLCKYLTLTDKTAKWECLKDARVERLFIHTFVAQVVKDHVTFMRMYRRYMVEPTPDLKLWLNTVAESFGCNRYRLYCCISEAKAFLEAFYNYRNSVIDLYVKNASKKAKAHTMFHSNVDFEDLRQSILRAYVTGLDKYDYRKGALTAYLAFWAKNATRSSESEYGIAYTLPQQQKRKLVDDNPTGAMNFSVSLDTSDGDDALHDVLTTDEGVNDDIEVVQRLLKNDLIDPYGIARLCLDVGEYYSKAELNLLAAHAVSD